VDAVDNAAAVRGIHFRDFGGVIHALVAAADRHDLGRGFCVLGELEGAAALEAVSDLALVRLAEQLGAAWARGAPHVLRARVADALWRGDGGLLLLRARSHDVALSLEDVAHAPRLTDLVEPAREHSWVAVRLLGLDGEPLAGVDYELTLADGSTETGTTDGNGEGRHEGIVRGSCIVTFHGLRPTLWQRGQQATTR
jgi:hypothetical protein